MSSPQPLPLAGLRVLVTRPEGDGAEDWKQALLAAGATPLSFPTVRISPPPSWHELDQALADLPSYAWLIFTSQTAVNMVARRCPGERLPALEPPRIAAVGPKTARAVVEHGGKVSLVPGEARQEGLVDAFATVSSGTRILFPIGAAGRTFLADALRARGCHVDLVLAYQTVAKPNLSPPPDFDLAVFASPSALRAFVGSLGTGMVAGAPVAVIGPTTAREAERHGLRAVVARAPNVDALISALAECRKSQGDPHVLS